MSVERPAVHRALMDQRQHKRHVESSLISGRAATEAWQEYSGSVPAVLGAELLKHKLGKSLVYRLELDAGKTRSVIAKWRSSYDRTEVEMYTSVLPSAGLAAPTVYGEIRDPVTGSGWLFMEDLGDAKIEVARPDSRQQVAEWLATLHQVAVPAILAGEDRGLHGYLALVLPMTRVLTESLTRSWMTASRRAALVRALRSLERIERNRASLENVCSLAPRVIVHGDLVTKNMRVRTKDGVRQLLVFDWETAGAGVPSIDLSSVPCDLDKYVSAIRTAWTTVTVDVVDQLARVGQVFRALAELEWQSTHVLHEWSLSTGFEQAEQRMHSALLGAATDRWA